ncbi:hypothetical protein J5O32_005027 [Escherichia coli]|nr:hypothetical protein [Escherichia coli]
MKQSKEQRIEQLREKFHQQTTAPRPETLKRLLVLEPQTLNNIVENQVGVLAESYTDSEPIALGVQLFVKISRQFNFLPDYVVVDLVLALGNLYSQQDQFAEVLSDMGLLRGEA